MKHARLRQIDQGHYVVLRKEIRQTDVAVDIHRLYRDMRLAAEDPDGWLFFVDAERPVIVEQSDRLRTFDRNEIVSVRALM